MTHNVLKSFWIHSGIGTVGAECVSECVRCDIWQLFLMVFIVFFYEISQYAGKVTRRFRIALSVEKKKIAVSVNLNTISVTLLCQYSFQCLISSFNHRYLSLTTFGFGCFNVVPKFRVP